MCKISNAENSSTPRKLSSVLSDKAVFYILLALLVALLIPMLLIARYDVPSTDDYNFSGPAYQAWIHTRSVRETLKAAAAKVTDTYKTWQGTFSALLMFCLAPCVWSEKLYFLTPLIMLTSLFIGVISLCHVLLRRLLGATKYQAGTIAIIILIAYTQLLPSPVQGFYWYNGSVYYTFFFGVSLVLYSLIFQQIITNNNNDVATPPTRINSSDSFSFRSSQ